MNKSFCFYVTSSDWNLIMNVLVTLKSTHCTSITMAQTFFVLKFADSRCLSLYCMYFRLRRKRVFLIKYLSSTGLGINDITQLFYIFLRQILIFQQYFQRQVLHTFHPLFHILVSTYCIVLASSINAKSWLSFRNESIPSPYISLRMFTWYPDEFFFQYN